ncbi:hypothetical protein D3C72_908230 [compost metagenome]
MLDGSAGTKRRQIHRSHPLVLFGGAAAHQLAHAPGPLHRRVCDTQLATAGIEQVRLAFARVVTRVLIQLAVGPAVAGEVLSVYLVLVEGLIDAVPHIQPAITQLTQGVAAGLQRGLFARPAGGKRIRSLATAFA